MQKGQLKGLVLVPKWPTQTWWQVAMKMLVQSPVVLPMNELTLYLPNNPNERHLVQNVVANVSLIRKQLRALSTTATRVMEASWRSGTRKQYESTLSR